MLAGAPSFTTYQRSDLTITTWLPAFSFFLSLDKINDPHLDSSTVSHITPTPIEAVSAQPNLPAWRSVLLVGLHLPLAAGFSQRGWLDEALGVRGAGEDELDTASQDSIGDESPTRRLSVFKKPPPRTLPAAAEKGKNEQKEVLLSQYLEKSFALHDAIHSSQVIPADESTLLEADQHVPSRSLGVLNQDEQDDSEVEATFFSTNSTQQPVPSQNNNDVTFTSTAPQATAPESTIASTSTTSTASSDASSTIRPTGRHRPAARSLIPRQTPSAPHLLPLSSLPTPSHLHAIHPQTMTVDLIVGVISASTLRVVTVRRTGRQVGVLELLVGDETRAGFSVTFWVDITQEESQGQQSHVTTRDVKDELRESLEALRKGDVVLMRNVALSEFQKVVRGNSLGRSRRGGGGRGGNATSVALLWRAGWMRDVMHADYGDGAQAVYDSDDLDEEDDGDARGFVEHAGKTCLVKEKTKRVRDWTKRFVPAAITPTRRKEKRSRDVAGSGTGKRRRTSTNEEADSMMSGVAIGGAFRVRDDLPPDDSMLPGS